MADKRSRKVIVEFDCEHLTTSPLLGNINDGMLSEGIREFLSLYLDVDMVPGDGDFYVLRNPQVILKEICGNPQSVRKNL